MGPVKTGWRKLHAPKKKIIDYRNRDPNEGAKYVPYIPPVLVTETFKFLDSKANVKMMLDVIMAPIKPKETKEQRVDFTRRWEIFKAQTKIFNRPYRQQEQLAEFCLYQAINNLPSDLYPEAVAQSVNPLPPCLRPHVLYRRQILKSLSDYEERCLQIFQNLMHLRFPFTDIKKRSPGLFWVTQLGAVHRARIAALSKTMVKGT